MATLQQRAIHWRDRAIARSEAISDAWQVGLAYAGRGAEIILFICMAISLVQMIPTITLPDAFTGAVFVIQMITLDVAGFGLNSLAKAVGRLGDEETAKKAGTIGTCLIAIMIISMLSGGVSRLFGPNHPDVKTWMGYIDDVLILIRIGMTVLYGKIMHSLRDSQQHMQQTEEDEQAALREEITQLQTTLANERQNAQAEAARLTTQIDTTKSEQATIIEDLKGQLSRVQSDLNTITDELSQTHKKLSLSQQNESFLQASIGEEKLSFQAEIEDAVKVAREEMKPSLEAEMEVSRQQLQAEIEELKRVNSQLKAELKGQVKAPIKPTKQLSSEKFETRTFVFSCLQQNSKMKFSEMAERAKKQGQELSEPTVSRYRKEYRETFTPGENESSAMEG